MADSQHITRGEPLSARPLEDGMHPPVWEVLTAWGGQLAVIFPELCPCPPHMDGAVNAEHYAHLFAAAPALRDALLGVAIYDGAGRYCWCGWRHGGQPHEPACTVARAALAAASPPDAQTEGAP